MTRRFSRYKWAMQKLAGNVPATGPFKEYNDWRTGAKVVTYTRSSASKPGSFEKVGIQAFAFGDADMQKILVEMSSRAKTNMPTALTAAGVTALGHAAALTGYFERFGFTPAKAIIFVSDPTQADTLKPSEITGVRYNPREGSSNTCPFGRTTATDGEGDRAAAIQAIIATVPNRSVSFMPERARI